MKKWALTRNKGRTSRKPLRKMSNWNRSRLRGMGMQARSRIQMKMMKWLVGWIRRTSMMSYRVYSCSTRSLREARITSQHGWARLHPWSLMVWELEATGRLHTLRVIRSWRNLSKDWAHMTFKSSALLIRATSSELTRHTSDHKIQKKRLIFWMRPSSDWSRSPRIHNRTSIWSTKKQTLLSSETKTRPQIQQIKTHSLRTQPAAPLHNWNKRISRVQSQPYAQTSLRHPKPAKWSKSKVLLPLLTENHHHPNKSNSEVYKSQQNFSFFEFSNFSAFSK